MRARSTRAVLSGLGIALGIAALVAVVGLSSSSKAQVNQQLDALGTNLLSVSAGNTIGFSLPATANPSAPEEVRVSRPSDALAATAATDAAFTGLLLGLGAAALLVGGVGVANTMVISVLERRQEIGLRRALGATRRHILGQFLGESVALSVMGELAGAVLGSIVTAAYAYARGWPISIPLWVVCAGLAITAVVGLGNP